MISKILSLAALVVMAPGILLAQPAISTTLAVDTTTPIPGGNGQRVFPGSHPR